MMDTGTPRARDFARKTKDYQQTAPLRKDDLVKHLTHILARPKKDIRRCVFELLKVVRDNGLEGDSK